MQKKIKITSFSRSEGRVVCPKRSASNPKSILSKAKSILFRAKSIRFYAKTCVLKAEWIDFDAKMRVAKAKTILSKAKMTLFNAKPIRLRAKLHPSEAICTLKRPSQVPSTAS